MKTIVSKDKGKPSGTRVTAIGVIMASKGQVGFRCLFCCHGSKIREIYQFLKIPTTRQIFKEDH